MAQLRRWLPFLVLAALLMLIAGAASIVDLKAANIHPPDLGGFLDPPAPSSSPAVPSPTITEPPGAGGPVQHGVHPFLYVVIATVLTFIIGTVLFVLLLISRSYLRARKAREFASIEYADTVAEQLPETDEVRAVLQAGLADIDEGDDPRKAVIASWLRLEKAAALAGIERLASDTPGDLVTRLLSAYHVNDRVLARLADSYRQARYAPDVITEQVRTDARQALTEIDAQLANMTATTGVTA